MMRWKQLFTPVQSIEPDEAREFMAAHPEGSYTLLDVRQPGEYEKDHLPGAKLVPLPNLADSLRKLDPLKPIIVY
jgi:rhodanese-related sulfurtransferase